MTHQYSSPGTFTVTITGNQSDGQSATKKIALEVRGEMPAPPGPTPSGPAQNTLVPFLSIIAIAITGIVIVAAVLITRQRKEPPPAKDPHKVFSARTTPRSENRPPLEELTTISSGTGVEPQVLDTVIKVAAEIAREGREGQAIGTAFVVGDTKNVLKCSKQFVLNPFYGHQEAERQITDTGIQGTIKEFAQLDGAFLITGNGVVEAAGRCITVDLSQVDLPGGMGSPAPVGRRHHQSYQLDRDCCLAERWPDLHFPKREDRVRHQAVRKAASAELHKKDIFRSISSERGKRTIRRITAPDHTGYQDACPERFPVLIISLLIVKKGCVDNPRQRDDPTVC